MRDPGGGSGGKGRSEEGEPEERRVPLHGAEPAHIQPTREADQAPALAEPTAFDTLANDLREALPIEIELGKLVRIQGARAIYHVGRGVHVRVMRQARQCGGFLAGVVQAQVHDVDGEQRGLARIKAALEDGKVLDCRFGQTQLEGRQGAQGGFGCVGLVQRQTQFRNSNHGRGQCSVGKGRDDTAHGAVGIQAP